MCNSVLSDTDRRRRSCRNNDNILGVTNECGRVLGASNGFCNNGVLGVTNECGGVLGVTNECNNVLGTSVNNRCCCRCICCCGTWC